MKIIQMVIAPLLLVPFHTLAEDDPVIVAAYEEPRHRLVFEKNDIRIFNTNIPAGDTSLYHFHKAPTMYVILNGALMRNQNLNEDWTDGNPDQIGKPGQLLFRDYRAEPQTHRVNNVGKQPFQVIGVINSGTGNEDHSSTKASAAPEVTNQWFSAYRVELDPGQSTDEHEHAKPVLIVQVNQGNSNVIEHEWPTAEKTVAGTWSWHDAGVEHQLRNLGRSKLELIEIEVK
jgi:quercetin dioxygenase-like cupin family protein